MADTPDQAAGRAERKPVLLRLDPAVHAALVRWASDDLTERAQDRRIRAQQRHLRPRILQHARSHRMTLRRVGVEPLGATLCRCRQLPPQVCRIHQA